jgi:acetylornithine deacetylase/succinyl-diaminopimelate desuccinylase-like protein
MRAVALGVAALALAGVGLAAAQQTPPARPAPVQAQLPMDAGRTAFRELYREMVEIDSSPTTGSCTRVVRAVETRLRAAGFTNTDYEVVIPPEKPEDGNIVAWIKGSDTTAKPVLLLAHIDVVDARREDWERDPFRLVEENGFFYGRGANDDKAMAAVFLDLFVRLKRETGFSPRRGLKLALTCGEETSNRVNGVDFMMRNRRELLDAAFAINEGAGGLLSADLRPLALEVQAGEKIHQVMTLEVVNDGGHSSRPVPDNAIYRLSDALKKVSALQFPIQLTPVMREYFRTIGPLEPGPLGRAMSAVARNPNDRAAMATLAADPSYNAKLRTTCVATRLDAGHADNALPQRARATLSCRVMQGTTPEQVQTALQTAINDAQVKVTIERRRDGSPAPVLTDEVMGPVRETAQRMWPGVVIAPNMTAGATDGRFLMNAGIPTYGMSGMFSLPGEFNAHGLNEKMRVRSLYEGRDFLESIVRAYVR